MGKFTCEHMKSKILCVLTCTLLIGLGALPYVVLGKPYWLESDTIEEYYAIYDVENTLVVDGKTLLMVEIPDGSIQLYEVSDAPIGYVEEVCFKIPSDNYEEWEVVA